MTMNNKDRQYLEAIGKNYNSITATADYRHYLSRRRLIIRDMLNGYCSGEGLVVDLASGTGNYSESIANCRLLLNFDLSFNALKEQYLLRDNIVRINADALHIPLKDRSVDCILLIGLVHHIPSNLDALFQEIVRILKIGGVIIIDEANAYNLAWFVAMKISEIDKINTMPIFPCNLKKLAKAYNLSVKKELFWGFMPPGIRSRRMADIFGKLEEKIESSYLKKICTRYTLVLMK